MLKVGVSAQDAASGMKNIEEERREKREEREIE